MPKKMLPSAEEMEVFTRLMRQRGFEPVSQEEFHTHLASMRLVPPSCRRKREGRTLAFRYEAKGLVVWVWTTYMPALGRAAEYAAGWVLIIDKRSVRYSSHAVPRTKNFLKTLRWLAAIAQWRVDHRPDCPICGEPMGIAFGQEIKSRHWRCRNHRIHAATVRIDWKQGLPPEALEFERPLDEERARRYARNRAAGEEPGAALKRRKRWTRQEPQP